MSLEKTIEKINSLPKLYRYIDWDDEIVKMVDALVITIKKEHDKWEKNDLLSPSEYNPDDAPVGTPINDVTPDDLAKTMAIASKRARMKKRGDKLGGRKSRVDEIVSTLRFTWTRQIELFLDNASHGVVDSPFLRGCERVENEFARSTVFKALKEVTSQHSVIV